MGVSNNSNERMTYLDVMFGKVVRKVKPGTEDAIERENKNGDKVYELHYDNIEGRITKGEIHESENYGKYVNLFLEDSDGEKFKLSIKLRSGYGRSFMYRVPNIDLTKELRITPYNFEADDRRITGLNVYQEENKIAPKWTKDEPGSLPQLEKVQFQGEDKWDDTKRMEFFVKHFEKHLESLPEPAAPKKEEPKPSVAPNENFYTEEDDLPF